MKNSEAILVTPKQFEIQECTVPEPKDNEILMKVEYVGMCGSDIHGFEFGPFIPPKDPNQKIGLGHEVAGEIVKVGMSVTKFKIGDKVLIEPGVPDDTCEYCRTGRYNICPEVDFMATQPNYKGALTQYMTHPEEWTYHIPEGMSTLEGALVEPAAVGMHAAILGGAQVGKSIVILGGGTIGLMTLQACLSLGATDITVVDVIEKRLELAKKLGAKRVINGKKQDIVAQIRATELYGNHGVALVFETAGSTFTAQQALQIVARGGKIMMVGTQSQPVSIDFLKINREVVIQTAFRYCNNFPQTIEAIATGKFKVKDMITNIYDYKEVQTAFMEAIDPIKKLEIVKGVIKVAE
ncbi:MAG: NAD(P)-dependent alcohol dehydrogenase [Lachnospiraceae bacterium]